MDYESRLTLVGQRIDEWVNGDQINGASIAVAHRGEIVWEHHSGDARPDLRSGGEVLWPIASISKLHAVAMIMALVERGELTLGTTVESVIPEFTNGGREAVTIRHLVTHTSGLIYESPLHAQRLIDQTPYDELIDEAYIYPLMFSPGSKLSYSDYGIALAGRVAERITGKDFVTLVDELVCNPGSLDETTFRPDATQRKITAHVEGTYAEGTEGAMYNSEYGLDLAHPAFGTVSSVRDLARFGLLFAPDGPRIVSEATVRAMTVDQTGGHTPVAIPGFMESDVPAPWGLGFMIARAGNPFMPDLIPEGSYGHGGASGCTLWINPVDNIVVAYVSNKHALTGRPPFARRLASAVNMVTAALTRN